MTALLVPASAVLVVLAPSLTSEVLGPRWEGTVPVIQVLVAAGLVGLLGEALAPLFHGVGRPDRQVAAEVVQACVLIAGAYVIAGPWGIVGAAAAWLPASCAAQGLGAIFAQRMLIRPFAGMAVPLATIGCISLVGSGVAWAIDDLISGVEGLVIAIGSSALVVTALEWMADRQFGLGLQEDLGRLFPRLASCLPPRAIGVERGEE